MKLNVFLDIDSLTEDFSIDSINEIIQKYEDEIEFLCSPKYTEDIEGVDDLFPKSHWLYEIARQATNWNEKFKSNHNCRYHYYQVNHELETIGDNTNALAIISEIKHCYNTKNFYITSDNQFVQNLYVIRDDMQENAAGWMEIDYSKYNDLSVFELWLYKYKKKRIFEPNPKHDKIFTHQNKQEEVSKLLCTNQEAQKLLNDAIGSIGKELYNFDSKYKYIIEFKLTRKDGDLYIYHGYHLTNENVLSGIKNKKIRNELKIRMSFH